MIYLDNAATTVPLQEVIEEVLKCLTEDFGNPSSAHTMGSKALEHVNNARKILAEIFRVPLQGVIFCSSGTESDNLAIKGCFGRGKSYQGNMVTCKLEHAAVLKTASWLEERGVELRYVSIDKKTGLIDLDNLKQLIDQETRLVSIQHVNSETGIVQNLKAIGKTVKSINPKLLFHSDGVQGFTKKDIDLKDSEIDLYTISGHKIQGIKGAGALIFSNRFFIEGQIHGGGQEFGLRSGTENVPAIVALGQAASIAVKKREEDYQKVLDFSSWFKQKIADKLTSLELLDFPQSIPHIISLSSMKIPGEVLLHHFAEKQIYLSTGSACNANSKRLSTTLQALGLSASQIKGTIRLSVIASEIPKNRAIFWKEFCQVINELEDLV